MSTRARTGREARKRLRFHRARTWFWAVQIPPAVYVGGWMPQWEHWLFTYLIVISIAALVESAATDWDQARHAAEQQEDQSRRPSEVEQGGGGSDSRA